MNRFLNSGFFRLHPRQWVLAGLATVLLLLVIFATERDDRPLSEEHSWFLPRLRADTSALDKVVLWSSKGKLTLEKKNNQWVLPQKDNYPADLRAVVEFILPLREMKTLEKKTAQPALLPQLGLDEQQGTHVILMAGDTMLGDFVLGKTSRHGQGGFVRRATESQAWLVNKMLFAPLSPLPWLNRKVLDVAPDSLLAIRVTASDQPPETRRLVSGKQTQEPTQSAADHAPAKSDIKPAQALWQTALRKALSPLLFEDVKARPDGPLRPEFTSDVQTADGLIYHFDHFRDGAQWWTAMRVQAVADRPGVDSRALSPKRRQQLAVMNAQWRPWLYRLPAASLQAISLGRIGNGTEQSAQE